MMHDHVVILLLFMVIALCSASERSGLGLAQLSAYAHELPGPTEDCSTFGTNHGTARVVSNLGTAAAAVGDIVVFKCQTEANHCNASQKQFSIHNRAIGEGVIILNSETAVLHMCVSAETNGTYVKCECPNGNATSVLDMIYIVSARLPAADSMNITCWSDSAENLTCYWNPSYKGFPPELEMKWTASFVVDGDELSGADEDELSDSDGELRGPCQLHPGRTMCTIPAVLMSHRYFLNITGTCSLGRINLRSQVEVNREIVKPRPITVNRVNTTATSIELELLPPVEPPGSYMSFLYVQPGFDCEALVYDGLSGTVVKVQRFLMRGDQDTADIMARGTPVTFTLNITGLLPFQLHRIRMRCRINSFGRFWSDSVYESATTREAAPWVGPTVFYTSGFTPSKRHCMNGWYGYGIYWQGLPQASGVSNGLIAYYTVQLHSGESSRHWPPRSTSLARVGADERQAWICLPGESRHVITVHAATGAGVGPAAGALVIPTREQIEALAVKPCHIFVRRGNGSDVTVTFRDSGSSKTTTATNTEHEVQPDDGSDNSSFWTVAWCLQADGNCKGDIHQIRSVTGFRSQTININGSVLEYGFGISRTVDGVSGGITWAECSHDTLAGPSLVDEPKVIVDKEGVHVQIKREYCTSAVTPEEPQMLRYCRAPEKPLEKCAVGDVSGPMPKGVAMKVNTSTCCQGDIISRELDSCDEFILLPLIDDASDYIVWLSYSSSLWDHLSSAAVFASQFKGNLGWTIEIICIVVGCAIVAGAVLVVFAYRKLKPNMKLGRIYKVPPLREMHSTSSALFDDGMEKHKEYVPMMQWQAHVNLGLSESDVCEAQHSPVPSVSSGDSGLSSVRSRGVSRTGADDVAESSFHTDYSPRSSTFFPDETEKGSGYAAVTIEVEQRGTKPCFSNTTYQGGHPIDDYFRPASLTPHGALEAAVDAESKRRVELDAASAKKERESSEQATAAAGIAGEPLGFHGLVDRSTVKEVIAREQPDVRVNESDRCPDADPAAPLQLSADLSVLCARCNGNRLWRSTGGGRSTMAECRCAQSGGLPDDYCYAGNKLSPAGDEDANDSAACSSAGYVQCAQNGYDDDDVGDEPAVVDISQFF